MTGKFAWRAALPLLMAAVLLAGFGSAPALAALPGPGSAGACAPGTFGTLPWCFGDPDRQNVTTLESGTANCQGTSQYISNVYDANHVKIQYTYSNGSHACMKVHYTGVNDGRSCEYWFYVPRGFATGTIVFGWWDWNGAKHYASLYEGDKSGWQFAFRATDLAYIEFQDNNGETGTQLGWADQKGYGFWVDNCQNP